MNLHTVIEAIKLVSNNEDKLLTTNILISVVQAYSGLSMIDLAIHSSKHSTELERKELIKQLLHDLHISNTQTNTNQ